MDDDVVPLEKMRAIYDKRGTAEELDLIRSFLEPPSSAPSSAPTGGARSGGSGCDGSNGGAGTTRDVGGAEQELHTVEMLSKVDRFVWVAFVSRWCASEPALFCKAGGSS
jgi:hypothetical protein